MKKKTNSTKSKAQAMVEFAIALPLLLLLLYGLLEAGRLLFMYSTVVTASRQAVRYGSATGEGTNGAPRYQDCIGMKNAAQNFAYLGQFDAITIVYDTGPGNTPYDECTGDTDLGVPLTGNSNRVVVTVTEQFTPIVPNLVPFIQRNITATSARTILNSVSIVVEQPAQDVVQDPTTTEIDFDTPDPSAIGQSVTIQVSVYNTNTPSKTPSGTVEVTGADTNCQITLNSNGWGTCTIIFTGAGVKTITATYSGDDEHLTSDDTEGHTVTLWPTVTIIESVSPSPSIVNQNVIVTVRVSGGTPTPTGTVNVNAGGNRNCTITLSNGAGSCTLNFNQTGSFTITANYTGDGSHLPSSATRNHQVLTGTPTATLPPTSTPIPSSTPIPTLTPVPTVTGTAVPQCNSTDINHGPITKSGNTLSMTITNPYAYPLTTGAGSVTWNDDKGHQTGADKSLSLRNISIGGTTVWTGSSSSTSTMPWIAPAVIPANSTVTITFTFHQSYDNFDGTESIFFQITTNGCNGVYVSSS